MCECQKGDSCRNSFCAEKSGDGVVTTSAARTTAQNAFYGQPKPFERAIFADSFNCILRTSGGETAGGRREGGNARLIEADRQNEEFAQPSANLFPKSFHCLSEMNWSNFWTAGVTTEEGCGSSESQIRARWRCFPFCSRTFQRECLLSL